MITLTSMEPDIEGQTTKNLQAARELIRTSKEIIENSKQICRVSREIVRAALREREQNKN